MVTIDLTNINRFENKDIKFINKILHPNEIKEYQSVENKPKFLAIRWAIKEALFKNNNKYSEFNKICINKINNKYEFQDYNISTSSEDNYIIALVEKRQHWS